MSNYKRGTIVKNGREYGIYPDGTLYRIYSNRDIPFLQVVDVAGETKLRVRQATELGYAEIPVGGCADLAYENSALRRSRAVGGGNLVNAITCSHQLHVFIEL